MDSLDILCGIHDHMLFPCFGDLLEKPLSHALKVFQPPLLQSILASLNPLERYFRRQIEKDGLVWPKPLRGNVSYLPEGFGIQSPRRTLVYDVREKKSVAHDRIPPLDRWQNKILHQLGSRGHVQKHLGCAAKRDILPMEQNLAYRFPQRRATWIPQACYAMPSSAKKLAKQIHLGRFPRTIDAIDRNKHTCHWLRILYPSSTCLRERLIPALDSHRVSQCAGNA